MGFAGGQHAADQAQHRGAVRPAVAEVAHKDQAAAFGVVAFVVIAQMRKQLCQRGVFAVDISHDIEGAGGEGLD